MKKILPPLTKLFFSALIILFFSYSAKAALLKKPLSFQPITPNGIWILEFKI